MNLYTSKVATRQYRMRFPICQEQLDASELHLTTKICRQQWKS